MLQLNRPLVVATASPNRRKILAEAGLSFETAEPDVDESLKSGDTPEGYVRRLALAKARAIKPPSPYHLILTADTCIDIEGDILGKPEHAEDARAMLKRLSGAWHEVWGGIALRDAQDDDIEVRSVCTKVRFTELSEDMIDWYIATGEPFGRAGAYAIQGQGRVLVASVDGCFTNVIGLSLPVLFALLQRYSP